MNGVTGPSPEDDDGGESSDSGSAINSIFPPREGTGRSVSSSLHHDRTSTSSDTATLRKPSAPSSSSRHPHHRTPHRPHSAMAHSNTAHEGSPPTARETFLNYFFGQNGPGPIAGSSLDRTGAGSGSQGLVPVGRDTGERTTTNASQMVAAAGLGMAGSKRGATEVNNAAYDMKSLGKHIEAVSSSLVT